MSHLEQRLIKRATRKHKKIYPCGHKSSLADCFTEDEGRLMLWFNTEDQSTHVITTSTKSSSRKKNF